MNINIYNKTGNKDLYLFFDYADTGSTGVTGFSNLSYIQPWTSGTKKLTEPHAMSFDYLNSGTFWYIVTNETGAQTIKNNPSTAMGTADPNWVGGFFELSYLKDATEAYFDITNVDQIGLFCGVNFLDSNGLKKGQAGYGKTADKMISGLITACKLASTTKAKVSITGSDQKTYSKLLGPTVASVSDQYNAIYDEYIKAIGNNKTKMTINSDSTISTTVTHSGTQLKSFEFTGYFGQPDSMPTGATIDKSEVVLYFKCTEEINPKKTGGDTYIFFTEEAINSGTIASGNSSGGMYVYPAFEYTDPNAKNPAKILSGGWANDVSLNWTSTGADAVKNTTCFMAMISSVGRDVVTAMNLGLIGVTKATKNFTYKKPSSYATQETQDKYINQWNKYITSNSDSYGMAYSDGTTAKVLFHPAIDGTIDCYIFGQSDPTTDDYWSEDGLA
jgi:hypothetical protein